MTNANLASSPAALKPFDPVAFMGNGWKFGKRNPETAKLGIPGSVTLVTHLKKGETYTTGDERVKRIAKAKQTPLGANQLLWYWENQDQIPEEWKEKTDGFTTYVFFDGDELVSPYGYRYSLFLFWSGKRWHWNFFWLDDYRFANDPSAVSAS